MGKADHGPSASKLDTAEEDAEVAPARPQSNASDKPVPKGNDDAKQSEPAGLATDDDANAEAPRSTANAERPSSSVADTSSKSDERLRVCDWIYLHTKKDPVKVQLQAISMDDLASKREYTFLDHKSRSNAKSKITWTIKGADVKEIQYYEQRVLEVAAERLRVTENNLTQRGRGFELGDNQRHADVQQAMEILRSGIKEHDSAVQRKLREPKLDTLLRLPLLVALYNLELSKVDQSIRRNQFAEAADKCDELRKQFKEADPTGQALISRYENIFVAQAKRSFEQRQFAEARDWLAQLEQRMESPQDTQATDFRRMLMQQAGEQVKLAIAAKENGNRDAAAQFLDRAKEIWPELSEIDDRRRQWDKEYPILHCAYLYLPQNFAPFAVRTPVERHAASLIFESLVRWTNTSSTGPHYRMCLAEERPISLALGRQFRLRRCEWWDPEQKEDARHFFSAEDVIWTEDLQRENPWAREQIALLDNASHHGDPFQVDIVLKMDHWQPLSFMDFWILPKYRFPRGKPEADALRRLNEHPAGTGPYYLAERRDDSVRFRANPRFREKGTPLIKEIHFDQMDPARSFEQFVNGRVDLIYGIRKAH